MEQTVSLIRFQASYLKVTFSHSNLSYQTNWVATRKKQHVTVIRQMLPNLPKGNLSWNTLHDENILIRVSVSKTLFKSLRKTGKMTGTLQLSSPKLFLRSEQPFVTGNLKHDVTTTDPEILLHSDLWRKLLNADFHWITKFKKYPIKIF